jgi:addiction module RelE/StbE family toxin
MVKVIWTQRSLNDLKDIIDYISKDSPKYASITAERLIKAVEFLEDNPRMGRMVPEVGDEDSFREIIYGNFRIIYQIASNQIINILTIHHCAKNLSSNSLLKKRQKK